MKKQTQTNWKPVRRGKLYCSSACGGGCTLSAYRYSRKVSSNLAKQLGKGWTARTHENLGWHSSVISPCGRIKVSVHPARIGSPAYTAFLGESDGICSGRWAETKKTPKAAIKAVIDAAKAELARIGAVFEGL